MSTPYVETNTKMAVNPRAGAQQSSLDTPRVLNAMIGVFFASTFTVAIGLVFGVRGDDIACLLWAAVAIMVAFAPLCLDIGRPRLHRHVFLSMLAISYMVNFVFPVWMNYIPAEGPMDPAAMAHSNLLPVDIARGQWMAIVGLLFFYVGYALPIRPLLSRAMPKKLWDWKYHVGLVATWIWIVLGWMIFASSQAGIIPPALGSGWLGGIATGTTFGLALLMAIYLRYESRVAWILLVILVPLTTIVMFMTGSKTAVLMPSTMVVLTWVVVRRQIRARWIVAGVIAISLLYPVAQFWRQDILQMNTLTVADVAGNPGPALRRTASFLSSNRGADYFTQGFLAAGVRLDVIGITSVIIRDTPSVTPYQNGRTLALVPIGFIPRLLWPDKPTIPIGNWISVNYTRFGYLSETNLAPSWIGEFYLNFGIWGVGGGMLVLGLMLRFTHEMLMHSNPSIPLIVASVIMLSRLLLGIQGSVSTVINTPIISLLPLFLAHLFVRFMGGAQTIDPNDKPSDA